MPNRRGLLISVDGLRPDGMETARTPHLDRLIREGAYAGRARTVMPSVTLPCHTSMLRGVEPGRHGITTNVFQPLVRPVPSLIDSAKSAGRIAGFFYNWEELRDLSSPGSLEMSVMHRDCDCPEGDQFITRVAIDALKRFDFDLLVLYLGWLDSCGHRHGWMSPEYLEAIAGVDECIGEIVEAYRRLGRSGDTVVHVTSDHGGHDRSHGTDLDEDMLIPWLLHGPGVKPGHALDGDVVIHDTCVTLAHLLDLPVSPEWDGRVIREALIDEGNGRGI